MKIDKLKNLYQPASGGSMSTSTMDEFASFLKTRFQVMSEYRKTWYENTMSSLALYDVFSDWLVHGEDYDKPVRFPTLRDFSVSLRDEFIKNPPECDIEAVRGESPNKAQALKFSVDVIKENIHEKRVKQDCIEDMILFGVGFRKINYMKVLKQKEINGEDETITCWDSVGSIRIDPRNVFIDEYGRYLYEPKGVDQKRDMIIKYVYSWSQFLDVFSDMEGVVGDLDKKISPVNISGESMGGHWFTSDRESTDLKDSLQGVKVYEYYNQEQDIYAIVANDVTILSPRPIPNNHGRIPVVPYIFEKRRDSFWGMSLGELVAPYIYAQETIFNLEFKGLKMRLQPVLAVDSSLGFNPRVHKAIPSGVWQFNVAPNESLSNKLMPLPIGATDQAGFYNMNAHLEDKMTITTNIDRRALFLSPGELATQTAFKNQSLQKRMNAMVYVNEIEAEGQLTELMISDIKQYMTEKVDVKDKRTGKLTKKHRKIKVEGYQIMQHGEGGEVKFEAEQGASGYFDLTGDAIDVDVEVKVVDSRSKSLLQEQKVGRILQFIPIATNLVSSFAQINPKLLDSLDVVGLIEQAAEAIDMDLQRTVKTESSIVQDQVQNEHLAFVTEQEVLLPSEETPEQSQEHLKEHIKLRYKYRNGKRTEEETGVWVSMSKTAKEKWMKHYLLTIENAIRYVSPDEVMMKKEIKSQENMPMQNQGVQGVAKSKLPDSKMMKPSVEEGLAQKTLLRG